MTRLDEAPRRETQRQWPASESPRCDAGGTTRATAGQSITARHFSNGIQEDMMARGSKSSYTSKPKRQAEHVERGYEGRGASSKQPARRASASVNIVTSAKKSGSGRGRAEIAEPSRRGELKASSNRSSAERSRAAKKGLEARR
jgi:hypothetical protein